MEGRRDSAAKVMPRSRFDRLLIGRLAVLTMLLASPTAAKQSSFPKPPALRVVERLLLSTAQQDFAGGHDAGYEAAVDWHQQRLLGSSARKAPHLACAEYGRGRHALLKLEALLSKESLSMVSNDKVLGTCFILTASASQAGSGAETSDFGAIGLTSLGPVPSALKIAPGVLDHYGRSFDDAQQQQQPGRLSTTHGKRMRFHNVAGLDLVLAPGVLPANDADAAGAFTKGLMEDLMSESMDLHSNNFWSDASVLGEGSDHLARPAGAVRAREWTRAADVVHELSTSDGPTPGDICSWGDLNFHHPGGDVLVIKGTQQ